MGAGSVVTPIYCEEISEVSIRGALGVFYDLQVGSGILLVYVIGAYVPYMWLCITCAVFPIIFFLTFLWMPESPIFLVSKGKIIQAEISLRWLRGVKYDIRPELDRIQKLVLDDAPRTKKIAVSSMLKSATGKALGIVACLMLFRQLSGINAVIYYTVSIFNEAGTSLSAFTSTIVVGVSQVVFTYLSSLLVERVGRRALLLISEITIALCQVVLATYFLLKEHDVDLTDFGWLPLLSLTVYIGVFNLGFGPLPWVMMAELVPNKSKGWASGVGVSVNWIMVFVITNVFGRMIQHWGPGIMFGMFGGMCLVGTLVVAVVVPETKGKTREQIHQELKGKTSYDLEMTPRRSKV